MENITIRNITAGGVQPGEIEVKGWIKTHRRSKNIAFIELTDGTCVQGLQLVINPELQSYQAVESKMATGCSVTAKGQLVSSPAKGQNFEMQVTELVLIGECDAEVYPLQKKGHTLEFLREQMHLRPRSNTLGAVFRVRSKAAFSIHKFFQERNFYYVHAPIITAADCEGAGEMFQVTTLPLDKVPMLEKQVDFSQDFFGEKTGLTVSGQLEAEVFACSMSKSYTFGPTFRAENSNTTRHLAEFWMIEPEQAFCDINGNMQLAEDCIKYVLSDLLKECGEELEFLHSREWVEKGLLQTLQQVVDSKFEVIDYTEAIKILEQSKATFEFPVKWGMDLQAEHERFLTDQYVKGPAIVINYPKEIKAFYMRLNEDDKTVRAMDVLVPRLGEIIGGSQREERHDVLQQKMLAAHINPKDLWWYLELRKYGTIPHAGFGLGFERLLMYVTGMQNIRDVIPMPRFPGGAKF